MASKNQKSPKKNAQGFMPDPVCRRVQSLGGGTHARVLFADSPRSAHVKVGTDEFYDAMTHVGDVETQRKHLEDAGFYNVDLYVRLRDPEGEQE